MHMGLLLVVVGVSIYRSWVVGMLDLPLYTDEAQYWYWSQFPAWGYFSKPPLIAWLIGAFTAVCGDEEACIRLASLWLYPCTTGLIYLIGTRLYNPSVGCLSALIFFTLPSVGVSSLLMSTDVLLLLCWAAALWCFIQALQKDCWWDWGLLGLLLGLGLLSKYTMGVFFVSALLYLLVTKQWGVLSRWRSWFAVFVACCVFSPNLAWNIQHQFPTFQHTAAISHLADFGWHWQNLLSFVLGQLGMMGPVFFPLFIAAIWCGGMTVVATENTLDDTPYPRTLLLCFSLPFLVLMCALALFGTANANWAAPSYIAASIGVAAWLWQCQHRYLLWLGLGVNALIWVGVYHLPSMAVLFGQPLTAKTDPYKRVRGWPVLGQQLRAIIQQYPQARLMARERTILSQFAYYARPQGLTILSWNPDNQLRHHYDLVASFRGEPIGWYLYISDRVDLPKNIHAQFATVKPVGRLFHPVYPDYKRDFPVYLLGQYQGEPRRYNDQ